MIVGWARVVTVKDRSGWDERYFEDRIAGLSERIKQGEEGVKNIF